MYMTIVTHIKPQVNALINGESRHQSMLMIHMCAQRTHSVW